MSLDDLFARSGRYRRRRVRLRLARRGRGLPGLVRQGQGVRRGPGGRVRVPGRSARRLAAIDRALAAETPRLASMFAMFNELCAEEEPVGAERLPPRGRSLASLAPVAFLATLAAIVALCIALSTQVHTVMRPCLISASAGPADVTAAAPAASAPVRDLNCQAYATPNK